MEKITGKIESVETTTGGEGSDKGAWTRAGYKIAGKTYSTFDKKIIDEFKAGDSVEFEFEMNGDYKNIKTMKKYEGVITERPLETNVTITGSQSNGFRTPEQMIMCKMTELAVSMFNAGIKPGEQSVTFTMDDCIAAVKKTQKEFS